MIDQSEQTSRVYKGMRPTASNSHGECHVEVFRDGEYLYDVLHVSESDRHGVEWGYSGGGPSDLALSILADVTNMHEARAHHGAFVQEVIVGLPYDVDPDRDADFVQEWELGEDDILGWLSQQSTHLG